MLHFKELIRKFWLEKSSKCTKSVALLWIQFYIKVGSKGPMHWPLFLTTRKLHWLTSKSNCIPDGEVCWKLDSRYEALLSEVSWSESNGRAWSDSLPVYPHHPFFWRYFFPRLNMEFEPWFHAAQPSSQIVPHCRSLIS